MRTYARFKAHKIQALWLSLVVLCIIIHRFFFKIELNIQLYLFIFFVLTLGMYHGLLDVILLKEHQKALKKMTFFSPVMLYLTVVIASLCIFILLPFITVPILLLITVWHFGEQQGEQSRYTQHFINRLIMGGASISLPFLFAFKQLDQLLKLIFADKFSYDLAILAWQTISYVWFLVFCCYFVYSLLKVLLKAFKLNYSQYLNAELTVKTTLNFKQWLELFVLFLSFYLLPLLLAFTLYFATYHSLQHVVDIHRKHLVGWFLQPILMVSLASSMLLIAAFYVFPAPPLLATSALKYPAVILSAIIALLTAITIPHATLISTWRSRLLNFSLTR